jgi:Mor family transcriptional regulator
VDGPSGRDEEGLLEFLPGDLRRIAEVAGLEAALKIARAFRGTCIYVSGLDEIRKQIRDERIRQDYDAGRPVKMISIKYGLTERGVWKILKKPGQKPPHPLMGRLFEDLD